MRVMFNETYVNMFICKNHAKPLHKNYRRLTTKIPPQIADEGVMNAIAAAGESGSLILNIFLISQ